MSANPIWGTPVIVSIVEQAMALYSTDATAPLKSNSSQIHIEFANFSLSF